MLQGIIGSVGNTAECTSVKSSAVARVSISREIRVIEKKFFRMEDAACNSNGRRLAAVNLKMILCVAILAVSG
jgi:hypothetical protein